MKMARHHLLWLLGAVAVVAALGWWALVFRNVVRYDYLSLPQATVCMGVSNGICELAMSLCSAKIRHWLDITWYSPNLLWVGLALVCAGLALAPRQD